MKYKLWYLNLFVAVCAIFFATYNAIKGDILWLSIDIILFIANVLAVIQLRKENRKLR